MSCPFCQSDNSLSAEFCRACGAELPRLSAAAATNIGVDAPDVASADALAVGTLLAGVYEVERVLGQGGFGITYGCHDQMLDRRVAIKEFFPSGCRRREAAVQPSRGVSETDFSEARAQFLAEARLLARCHHAGIVGVHTAFEANSTAYMVMELLHGSTLDRLTEARGGRLSETEAVRFTERAGEALQFVHDQGLLHRDIKPENIIATDDGRVMLIDFGTAREYAQGQAQGHTIVVTPGYAPLEQYARQARRGAFTDVYGLAATLYHLLTGAAPPAASDRAVGVMLRPVREENSQISASVARAIEAGLEMEIAKRPQSVREFLELMHASQKDVLVDDAAFQVALAPQKSAISQESATLQESAISPVQRDALRSLSHTPANFFSGALQARQQMLEETLRPAQSPIQSTAQPAPFAPVALAPSAFASQPSASHPLSPVAPVSSAPIFTPYDTGGGFVTQNAQPPDGSSRAVFWFIGAIFIGFGLLFAVTSSVGGRKPSPYSSGYSSPPNFSPPPRSSTSWPAPVTRNSAAEKARQEMELTPSIAPAAVEQLPVSAASPAKNAVEVPYYVGQGMAEFSPDGQRLAYVDNKLIVRVWDLSKHQVVRTFPEMQSNPPERLLFSPDGKKLVVSYQNLGGGKITEQMRLWDVRTGKALGSLSADSKNASFFAEAVLPDGRVLIHQSTLSPSSKGRAGNSDLLWDPATGKQSAAPLWDKGQWTKVAFSPDGKQLVIGGENGHTRWLDARTGNEKVDHSTSLTNKDFWSSPFRPKSFNEVNPGDPLRIQALCFASDGSAAATRNAMQISVFNAQGKPIGSVATGYSMTLAVSTGGKFLVEGGNWDSPERKMLWDVRAKQKIRLQAPEGRLSAVTFSPDGKQIIGLCSSGGPPSLVTWNTDAKPVTPFLAPQTGVLPGVPRPMATFLSPTSQLLATLTSNSIEIRQLDGTLTQNIYTGYLNGRGVALSLDGGSVAAELDDGAVQIWDVQTMQKKSQFGPIKSSQGAAKPNIAEGLTGAVRFTQSKRLIFSPDNNFLAHLRTTEGKNSVELWSLDGVPRPIGAIALSEPATALTFSADNRGLICGGKSGVVRWYDVATQTISAQIKGEFGEVFHLVASPRELAVVEGNDSGALVTGYDVRLSGGKSNQNQTEPSSSQTSKLLLRESSQIRLDDVDISLGMALSTDQRSLVSMHGYDLTNGSLDVWNLGTGVREQQLYFDTPNSKNASAFMSWANTGAISFSPDGNQISCLRGNTNMQIRDERQIITWKRAPKQ